MVYRNERIEMKVLDFLKSLPRELLRFPFDVKTVAEMLDNCKMCSYQEFSLKHGASVDEIIDYCESNDGCVVQSKNNKYVIMYNDVIMYERKKFTVAHEIGHIVLGHLDMIRIKKCKMIAYNPNMYQSLEREANYFAACLLCPIPVAFYIRPKNISEISRIFGISYGAAKIAWKEIMGYDETIFKDWHKDMIRLFS